MRFNLFTIIPLYLISLCAQAELKCSTNGTNVFYINGITTALEDARVDSAAVDRTFFGKELSMDYKGKVTGSLIYNSTRGFLNDITELYRQATRNLNNKESVQFYEEALKEKLKLGSNSGSESWTPEQNEKMERYTAETFELIKNSVNNPIKEDELTKNEIFKKIAEINFQIAHLLNSAAADFEVVNKIKNEFRSSLDSRKKIIAVAHSQGNEALRTAMNELRNEITSLPADKRKLFEDTFGVMHMASPSPVVVSTEAQSRRIRLNRDMVILGSNLILPESPLPATHKYEYSTKSGFIGKIPILGDIIESLIISFGGSYYHSMNYVYLAEDIYASSYLNPEKKESMKTIFFNNLVEVAESLGDNCEGPLIEITSPDGYFENDTLVTTGFAGANRMISLKASDKNDTALEKTTQFEWKSVKFIPENYYSLTGTALDYFQDVISTPADPEDLNSEQLVNLPFNTSKFAVEITATNKEGKKSTKVINLVNRNNKQPILTLQNSQCVTEANGYTYVNTRFVYRIDDDSQFTRGLVAGIATHESMNGAPHEIILADHWGLFAKLNIDTACPNRFNIGSLNVFCENNYSFIGLQVTSVRGHRVHFLGPNGSESFETFSRNHSPGNTYESVYRYPFPLTAGSPEIRYTVKVLDFWSSEMTNVGEVTLKPCIP